MIWNHDYKPQPAYHMVADERKTYEFIGMEYEFDDGEDVDVGWKEQLVHAIEKIPGTNGLDFYIKNDASISGVELVSHPFTYNYWKEYGQLDKICEVAKRTGYTNPKDKAGIHLHISKKCLGKTAQARDAVEARLVYIIEKFYDYFMAMGQRTRSMYCFRPITGLSGADSDATAPEKAKSCKNHNCCINIENKDTAEFRFFSATTDPKRILGYIQMVKVLVQYAQKHTFETIARENDLLAILDSDYPELNAILDEFVNNMLSYRQNGQE